MSERQAKKIRKNIGEAGDVKKQKNKSLIVTNIIAIVLVAAFLGLGIYAIAPKYIAEYQANQEAKQKTVKDFLSEKDISMDEFKAEYGIAEDVEVTDETPIDSLAVGFTLENYAKYLGKTTEELKAQYELGDNADASMIWQDAMMLVKTGIVAKELGFADFEELKAQMQLPDSVTADTTWGETIELMNAMAEAQQLLEETKAEGETVEPEVQTEAEGE